MRRLRTVIDRKEEFREILKEERLEYKGYVPSAEPEEDISKAPEYSSIENFVNFMLEEASDNGEIPKFTIDQVEKLSRTLRISSIKVINELRLWGLKQEYREPEKKLRGYRSPENKWASCPSYGCSGSQQILGWSK